MRLKLLLLFNHHITNEQRKDAAASLAVSSIVEPPEAIRDVETDTARVARDRGSFGAGNVVWISRQADRDYLLVQGDFGATYLMVRYAFDNGLIPIYSTTERQVAEETGRRRSPIDAYLQTPSLPQIWSVNNGRTLSVVSRHKSLCGVLL